MLAVHAWLVDPESLYRHNNIPKQHPIFGGPCQAHPGERNTDFFNTLLKLQTPHGIDIMPLNALNEYIVVKHRLCIVHTMHTCIVAN